MEFQKNKIDSPERWRQDASPMGGDTQWADGRSAKELANYITKDLPKVPNELEEAVLAINSRVNELTWKAEYVTPFPREDFGLGEGRHHDMIMFADDIFIGVEAKADEPFDKTLSKWLHAGTGKKSEDNRRARADAMCNLIFGKNSSEYEDLRYQLLSAMTGVLLETKNRGIDTAALMILTFKKKGVNEKGKPFYSQEKIQRNERDLEYFLSAAHYDPKTEKIETKNSGIANVYVKYITIET